MIVITGDTRGKSADRLRKLGWGRCVIDRKPAPYPGEPWMLDNGAFRMWRAQAGYDFSAFRAQAERTSALPFDAWPLIAVLPDRVAEGLDSLHFSMEWYHALGRPVRPDDELVPIDLSDPETRLSELPWYLAVQDGLTPADLEGPCPVCGDPIVEHDGLLGIFLGGTASWKGRTAREWRVFADRHRMELHFARAGTPGKVDLAEEIGASSIDSAFPLWTLERFRIFAERITKGNPQPSLF